MNKDTRVDAKTITEVQSESLNPSGRYGPLVARVPVIISQSKVNISINSEVSLDHTVLDIRDCTRNVYLTQCSLLDMGNKRHGKVHISGCINESIEYAASEKNPNSAELCFKNIKIPFEFAAKIEYCSRPMFITPNKFITVGIPSVPNQSMSGEKLFCELENSEICEADIIKKSSFPKENDLHTFDTLIEYMVVSITFTILQWQQVSIPRSLPYNPPY